MAGRTRGTAVLFPGVSRTYPSLQTTHALIAGRERLASGHRRAGRGSLRQASWHPRHAGPRRGEGLADRAADSGRSSQMPQVRAPRCANQKARRRHIYPTPAALRKYATSPPLQPRPTAIGRQCPAPGCPRSGPHHSTTLNGSHHRGERHIGATASAVAFASRLARARRTPRETARCGHPASRLPLPARLARSIHHSRRTSSRSLVSDPPRRFVHGGRGTRRDAPSQSPLLHIF